MAFVLVCLWIMAFWHGLFFYLLLFLALQLFQVVIGWSCSGVYIALHFSLFIFFFTYLLIIFLFLSKCFVRYLNSKKAAGLFRSSMRSLPPFLTLGEPGMSISHSGVWPENNGIFFILRYIYPKSLSPFFIIYFTFHSIELCRILFSKV